MSDILKRLKKNVTTMESGFEFSVHENCEAQREAHAEIERLREALKKIAACEKRVDGDVVDIARAALS